MAGYAGSEQQQGLQRLSDERAELTSRTAGACNVGRMLGFDDPWQVGLETVIAAAESHGVVGFRMLPSDRIPELEQVLGRRGLRLDLWDVFIADAPAVLASASRIVAPGLPEGLRRIRLPDDPGAAEVRAIQALMLACGVVPFSGAMLVGKIVPAATTVLADSVGEVVAVAHASLPHNRFSPFHDAAWGGLVAVREDQRGKGLGNIVNAMMTLDAVRQLAAARVYELVSAANTPSLRMVQAAGLVFDSGRKCGVASAGAARFTR